MDGLKLYQMMNPSLWVLKPSFANSFFSFAHKGHAMFMVIILYVGWVGEMSGWKSPSQQGNRQHSSHQVVQTTYSVGSIFGCGLIPSHFKVSTSTTLCLVCRAYGCRPRWQMPWLWLCELWHSAGSHQGADPFRFQCHSSRKVLTDTNQHETGVDMDPA